MTTVTVDILQEKALSVLKYLEDLKIIRLHKTEIKNTVADKTLSSKYKGSISMHTRKEVEGHLQELREEWN